MQNTTSSQITGERDRSRPTLGMWLYAVIWWTVFGTFTTLMFIWTWLAFLTVLFDRRRRWLHLMTVCVWGWLAYALNPLWKLRIEGREKLPMDGRAVLVPNHDSSADIPLCAALFRPFRFVSKKAVFSVPVLGWGMTLAGYIPVVRGDKQSVLEMFEKCRATLNDEVPILMFPEGTRSTDGTLKPFRDGAFQLAVDTDSPVYPIILAGTRDLHPGHRNLIPPFKIDVRVRVLDPVYPHEFDHDFGRLRDHVRAVMAGEKAKLTAELAAEKV